jgi:hypothetical protein
LPTFITSIGNYALSGCSALTEVIINATTPPTLGTGVFPAGVTVRVPATSWTAYITAWPGISILTIQ